MSDRENNVEAPEAGPARDGEPVERDHPPVGRSSVETLDQDRAGAGGAAVDSPGMPGGTLGTGGAREEDM